MPKNLVSCVLSRSGDKAEGKSSPRSNEEYEAEKKHLKTLRSLRFLRVLRGFILA